MANIKAIQSSLPAGGGAFELENLTIGIFLNNQPTHRLALGADKGVERPLSAHQGWILPAQAQGMCEYDGRCDSHCRRGGSP